MLTTNFGVEVEFVGITRTQAANVAADYLKGTLTRSHDYYDTHIVTAPDGRQWKFMYDGSIDPKRKLNGRIISADKSYSVELVTPILTYREDIEQLQELVRKLRKAGGFTGKTEGIHVHLDKANHTPRSIRNFVNIIASRNELLYKALEIAPERMRYCKKMDEVMVSKLNRSKPRTMEQIEKIWYEGYSGSTSDKYHPSRYAFLNLHSLFNGNGTLELRGYNAGKDGKLHSGLVRSYIVLSLALNHQALTQKCASSKKPQSDNSRYAMRTYLNRIGLIGDEFKNCREHLTASLDGSSAWRYR